MSIKVIHRLCTFKLDTNLKKIENKEAKEMQYFAKQIPALAISA